MSQGAKIAKVVGRRVWDSRGRPTVEAEVILTDTKIGRAIAPAGASRGTHEAVELRDEGKALGGQGVEQALKSVNDVIGPSLVGLSADDQEALDRRIIELDGTRQKAKLGGNATIAVSMALAHAAAASARQPLWRYLAGSDNVTLPMPMVQVFGGGAHASGRLDLQDFLMIPIGATSFDEAMVMSAEVYRAAGLLMQKRGLLRGVADEGGWWPEFSSNEEAIESLIKSIEDAGYRPSVDVSIALDIAASQFGKGGIYRFTADRAPIDSEEMVSRVTTWCGKYPIISVEDPLAEDDDAGMVAITKALGGKVQIVGDDYLVTSVGRIKAAASRGACNAVLLKPNQIGTLSEAFAAFRVARELGWRSIVSARSGETEDVTIVHLAVGWGAEQLKVGSFSRSERMAKWNEGIRVEAALGKKTTFQGRGAFK